MWKVLLIFIVGGLLFAQDDDVFSKVELELSPKISAVNYNITFPVSYNQRLGLSPGFDIVNYRNFFLNVDYLQKETAFNFYARLAYLGANDLSKELVLGLHFQDRSNVYILGMKVIVDQFYPFFAYSLKLNRAGFTMELSDQPKAFVSWDLSDEKMQKQEYFRMLSPANLSQTGSDEIQIKGYFLDKGKLFLNNKELTPRADGMFIEKVRLPNIGENELRFVVRGSNLDYYEYKHIIIRHYPYLDVSANAQESWLNLLGKIDGFKSSYLKPAEFVTRREFYSLLGKLFKFDPQMKMKTAKQFADVPENSPLRITLENLQSSGILNGDYKVFNPEYAIKRQEALLVLSRFLPLEKEDNVMVGIKEVPAWMRKDINRLMYYGVVNLVDPQITENLTRYDLYDMLAELIKTAPTKVINQNKDKKIVALKNIAERNLKFPNLTMAMLFKDIAGAVSVDAVQLIAPNKDTQVSHDLYVVYGLGAPGTSLFVNGKELIVGKDRKFGCSLALKPGKNVVNIKLEKEEKNYTVEYVKEFLDLRGNDYFSDVIKKMMTLGYLNSDKYFNGGLTVTKKELYLALKRIGYIDMATYKAVKNPEEKLTSKKMTSLVKELTGETIVYDINANDLIRRKLFVLMLYELSLVKKAYQKNFLSVILINLA